MAKYLKPADDNAIFWHFQRKRGKWEPKVVTVWHHDSGLTADHDLACFVCHNSLAVLESAQKSFGGPCETTFQPCVECQARGWRVTKLSKWGFAVPMLTGMLVGFGLLMLGYILLLSFLPT